MALYLEEKAPVLFPSDSDRQFAAEYLARAFPRETGPLIALHPGSGGERKNWPAERWAAMGDSLYRLEPGARVLLVGGEADDARIEHLRRAWAGRAIQLAVGLPLPELAAILQQTRLFLGHDSGISHIAAATGAASLLLFGPTDPDVWAPLSGQVKIVRAPGGDLGLLPPATVERALAEALGHEPQSEIDVTGLS
jgi:heptosyltransferase-2